MKRITTFLSLAAVCALMLSTMILPNRETAQAQGLSLDIPRGKIIAKFRQADSSERPAWVKIAVERSETHLKQQAEAVGLRDPQNELVLVDAQVDDLGKTHVRMNQVFNGIPVFGGQLITHLDGEVVKQISGRTFKEARDVSTKPRINAAQAIQAARAALGYTGEFAKQPEAQLVVLPLEVIENSGRAGATLTYQVELLIMDGTPATARHQYFVDARDGSIVWHFNSMDTGTGYSLYSGTVSIDTLQVQINKFRLTSSGRGYMSALDAATGGFFEDPDNYWGNFSTSNRQTAGVDAHFAQSKTWDYYANVHGRVGINNNGYQMYSYVHYGGAYNNAFWNGSATYFGDGDGSYFKPLVSVDVVAHETTHGLTQHTANLTYSGESGGSNESFSDIFGTAVEFYTGINPDYNIGEDCFTPFTSGDALRYMSNPRADGVSIDHYSQYYPGIDVHYSSGIQNNAFYLLAQGGTNPTSGISVNGIGRNGAEWIFYRALTVYLTPSANFIAVRDATWSAAADIYGVGSPQYNSTIYAWCAVGVGPCPGPVGTNDAAFVSQSVPSTMTAGQSYNVSVTMRNSGTTTWTSDTYKLGSQNPTNNSTWGGRIYLPAGVTVAPGSNHTFNFTVTAPTTPGAYNFQWRMVQEWIEWFGAPTPNLVINVTTGGGGCSPAAEAACLNKGENWTWNPATCRCNFNGGCLSGPQCPRQQSSSREQDTAQ